MTDDGPARPRVRLDLEKLAHDVAFLPTWRKATEADVRASLGRRGWVAWPDGWWTPPSELELQLTAYAVEPDAGSERPGL